MANELKPCPSLWNDFGQIHGASGFIAAPKVRERAMLSGPNRYRVECGCGTKGPFGDSEDAAIAAWNARAPSPAFVAMREALREILDHVEDMNIERVGSQCTLCHTFRMIGHSALTQAEKEVSE